MPLLSDSQAVKDALLRYRSVTVLGAHPLEHKAAHYVPRYLAGEGYDIYPVNPRYAGQTLFGKPVLASLADVPIPIEVLNVFRRSEHLPEHLPDILALDPLPKLVWLQLGIRHDGVAERLNAAGIDVIQDRCMLADHQYLL